MKTKRPKPTQDEVMSWLKDNHPELYIQATRERDWIWIRGSQHHQQLGAIDGKHLASLKTYGFRAKKEGTHKLSDGDEAVWYHTCQGKWFPYSKKRRGKSQLNHSKFMSKADALEIATNL